LEKRKRSRIDFNTQILLDKIRRVFGKKIKLPKGAVSTVLRRKRRKRSQEKESDVEIKQLSKYFELQTDIKTKLSIVVAK
jgi:hypothetical protein